MRSLLALLLAFADSTANAPGEAETFFELKIRPVLAGTCFNCHGGKKVSNGLRMDSREALLKGGENGPAIVPGAPDKSLLIQAIQHKHEHIKMPPDKRLGDETVADFAAWVKQGALWPKKATVAFRAEKHWAFEPIKRTEPPALQNQGAGAPGSPIDRFIAAKWPEHGLQPVELADKRTLIRRLYFDLIGLPPKPDEVDAFLKDESQDAYPKVVDRLLASPHYGERWGRHWMDVVRYADTAGDNADYPVPEARLYRDYIIDSFNADKPYDQFVQEQLAGDILAKSTPPSPPLTKGGTQGGYAERVVATGFLALARRYATAPYELWNLTLEDAIETTGRTFMGLTMRCARCHDHKFDPITQEDYYAVYGIFSSTQFPWAGGEEFASKKFPREHFVPLLPANEASPRLAAHREKIKRLEADIQRTEKEDPLAKKLADLNGKIDAKSKQLTELEAQKKDAGAIKAELAALRKERDGAKSQLQSKLDRLRGDLHNLRKPGLPADLPGAYAVQEGKPVDVAVHLRGEIDRPGTVVKRNVPKFLEGGQSFHIPAGASGRLQFAQWLTGSDHPLTARVMVNRLWQHHFGKGLVSTPSNFGLRGEPPTHPELLDWLASEFMASGGRQAPGWSLKKIHRLILCSQTYQRASTHEATNAAKDPANRWYWRFDRRRLEAEAIRDAMLSVSGKLDHKRLGPHPFPPIEKWGWTQHHPFKESYPTNHRSVYLMTQRFQRHPYLALFDGPDTNTTTEQRTTSTVPQQALFVMNSPFVQEQAEGFAQRLMAGSSQPEQRIELAHQLAWSRPARAQELEQGIRYVEEYRKQLANANVPAERLELEIWTSYARIMLSANEFVYVD